MLHLRNAAPASDAQMEDGSLDITFVENLSRLQVLALLPRLSKSGHLPKAHVKRTRAKSAVDDRPAVLFSRAPAQSLATPVQIEVVPGAVKSWRRLRHEVIDGDAR
jgi:diacylglycerol kinase family enzyme